MVGISALLVMRRGEVLVGTAPASLEAVRWGAHAALGVLWAGAFLAVWSLSNCAPWQRCSGAAWGRPESLLAHCCFSRSIAACAEALHLALRLAFPSCTAVACTAVLLQEVRTSKTERAQGEAAVAAKQRKREETLC